MLCPAGDRYRKTIPRQFNYPSFEPLDGSREGNRCSDDENTMNENDQTQMVRAVCHVFDLSLQGEFLSQQKQGDDEFAIEHIDLAHGSWRVRVRTLPSTQANLKAIRETGVLRLTHVVELSQSDEQPFTGADAIELLDALDSFFTFATGKPCHLACPSGFDAQGQEVWARWSSPRGPQGGMICWSRQNQPTKMPHLFQGFMGKRASHGWRETLDTAAWWYTEANSSTTGLVQGVVAAQIATESLAYQYCVREKGLISERGFKELRAADKIRLLFASVGVPTNIPPSAARLVLESNSRG